MESMTTRMLGKLNGKLKFLYGKLNFPDSSLRRLLLNLLIQPHLIMHAPRGNIVTRTDSWETNNALLF